MKKFYNLGASTYTPGMKALRPDNCMTVTVQLAKALRPYNYTLYSWLKCLLHVEFSFLDFVLVTFLQK